MIAREKILIINAHHRYSFYNNSLLRAVNGANQLAGPEYILVTVDFATTHGGRKTLANVAALTATVAIKHQPIRIYQCVDYNAGNTGSAESSILDLISCNQEAAITVPITYILDGSNHLARQRDENAYGEGDYRFIMKFIIGLLKGLPPAETPSPILSEQEQKQQTRSISAPPTNLFRSKTQVRSYDSPQTELIRLKSTPTSYIAPFEEMDLNHYTSQSRSTTSTPVQGTPSTRENEDPEEEGIPHSTTGMLMEMFTNRPSSLILSPIPQRIPAPHHLASHSSLYCIAHSSHLNASASLPMDQRLASAHPPVLDLDQNTLNPGQ